MKYRLLILSAASCAAILAPSLRTAFSTANAASQADLKESTAKIFAKLGLDEDADPEVVNAALIKLIDAANPGAKSPVRDELGLGPLRLPEGIEAKDVAWRKAAGLSTEHAVSAALMQKRHDDAVGKAKAAKARQPAVPVAALTMTDLAKMTVPQLKKHAATLNGLDLKDANEAADILSAIEAYNVKLAREEQKAS